jgi:acetyl-CoA C-acetyltransferase
MRNVCVIAGGQSQWGIRQATQRDMIQEAGKACFNDNPAVKNKDIDGFIVGACYAVTTFTRSPKSAKRGCES